MSSTKCTVPAQIFVGPRDPYDRNVEGPHLILRIFEARTLLISNLDSQHILNSNKFNSLLSWLLKDATFFLPSKVKNCIHMIHKHMDMLLFYLIGNYSMIT